MNKYREALRGMSKLEAGEKNLESLELILEQAEGELMKAINWVCAIQETRADERLKEVELEAEEHQENARKQERYAQMLFRKNQLLQQELQSLGRYALNQMSETDNPAYAAYHRERLDHGYDC